MKIQTKQDPSPVAYHPDTITARLQSAIDWLIDRDTGTDEYTIGEDLQFVQPHIVRAVESHAALVEACEALARLAIEKCPRCDGTGQRERGSANEACGQCGGTGEETHNPHPDEIRQARAALSAAKGEA